MTVAEAQQRVSSGEFTYWKAFHRINPIGEVRGDMQAALIAYTIAQANTGKGKKPKFKDFVLNFKGRERPTAEQLEAKLMTWARVYNANN
jgi:hypothetical protein